MRTLPPFVLFTPVFLMLAGCPIWGDGGGTGRCVGSACECDFDSDCPLGYSCSSRGFCDPTTTIDGGVDMSLPDVPTTTECRTHGDCVQGEYCDSSTDTCTDSNTCTDDSACSDGFICDFRDTCVPEVPGACRADNDCAATERCIEGFCRTPENFCQLSLDCAAGQSCVDGACIYLCVDDSSCGSGSSCQDTLCQPVSECQNSSECGADEHCVEGRCLADCQTSASACGAADYCGDDAFCRPDWRGTPFCRNDSDCDSGSRCVEGSCRTPCPGGTDLECRATDPSLTCGDDLLCESGVVPECALSRECNSGEMCIDGSCR